MDALNELSENFLTCSVCLQSYNKPKQLPCLHTFCRGCLSDHIKTSSKNSFFYCPECRREIISHGSASCLDPVDDFPDNFYVASMLASLKQMGVSGSREKLEATGDNCPNHPKLPSADYCTQCNVGVCQICQIHHRTCHSQHIPLHQAKIQAFSEVATMKVKMTALMEHSKKVNESIVGFPGKLRQRQGEIFDEITQNFSDLKENFDKIITEKETQMKERVGDMIKAEEKWVEEGLDEILAITDYCSKQTEFLDDEDNKKSINAVRRIHSMQDLIPKYTNDLIRLESETDVKKIEFVPENVESFISSLTFGKIISPHSTSEEDAATENPLLESDDHRNNDNPAPVSPRPTAPLMPSAPVMLVDAMGKPTWDLSNYSNPATWSAPNIIAPTHSEYPGMVISRPEDKYRAKAKATANRKEADRIYLERHKTQNSVELGDIKKLVQTAKLICRDPQDTRQSKFVGITPIAENVFVVADRWNKNLKLIKLKGPIVQVLPLKHDQEPWDATRVLTNQRDEIAVTFPGIRTIMFLEYQDDGIEPRLSLGLRIRTAASYGSLGCINAKELVGGVCSPYGDPSVDIISMEGRILRRFANVATYPRSIDTSPGHIIAVSDWTRKQIMFLGEEGKVVGVYNNNGLLQPRGIAYYEEGRFVVVDQKTGYLHKVTEEGEMELMAKVTDKANIVACIPTSKEFSREGLAVVIGTDEGFVYVYDGWQLVQSD